MANLVEEKLVNASELIGPPDDPAAVIKGPKRLDFDDPEAMAELARSLGVDPEDYAKAREQLENGSPSATATPSATSFTPSEQGGSGVAACSGSQREEESPSTATLLDEVEALLRRFVVFTSEGQPIAAALFVLNTYVFDLWDYVPYLSISSATSESGKSRLLDVLETVVHEPWLAIKPSEAVLFRTIEEKRPTLLLDESDSLSDNNKQAIVAVLNAGFQSGRSVPRAMGEKGEKIEHYDCYCPKESCRIG
jgi:hypothetical protein